MAEYLAAIRSIWKCEPMMCVAVVMALVAGVAALIETATRPFR